MCVISIIYVIPITYMIYVGFDFCDIRDVCDFSGFVLISAISVISVISVTYMISVVSVVSVWFVCYLFLVFVNSAMFFELLDRKHLAQDPMKLNTVLPFTSTHAHPSPSPSACRRVRPSVLAFASWLSLPLPGCQQRPSACSPAGPPNRPTASRKPR